MSIRAKRFRLTLSALGFFLLLVAGIISVGAAPDGQGDPPNLEAEYKSSNFCNLCHTQEDTWHTTAHAQMVKPPSDEAILGDLSDTEAVTIVWPDGDQRPIQAEDIALVLGGRYVQRYVSVITDANDDTHFYVLPVQWNVPQTGDQEGVWTPYHEDDWQTPERDWRVACAGCHTTGLDGASAADTTEFAFLDEWHSGAVELNVGCEACHGPGGAHMADQGTIFKSIDVQVCGQCHWQGQSPDSDHGYPVGYQPGLSLDESVFVPAAADDEAVWWPTGHAKTYNQYGEWLTSAHGQGKPLSSPDCARCHTTQSSYTEEFSAGATCLACHSPHGESSEDSEAVDYMLTHDSYSLCVDCHNSRTPEGDVLSIMARYHHPAQEMFEGWSVVNVIEAVPSGHFLNENGPRCVTCHMPQTTQIGEFGQAASHTMQVAVPGMGADLQPDSCSGCHSELVTADDIQRYISDMQTATEARLAAIDETMSGEYSDWVLTAIDFVVGDGSMGVHNPAYTDALLDAVEVELGLQMASAPVPSPEVLGISAAPADASEAAEESNVAESGLSTPSLILLGLAGLVIAGAAYVYFVREARA